MNVCQQESFGVCGKIKRLKQSRTNCTNSRQYHIGWQAPPMTALVFDHDIALVNANNTVFEQSLIAALIEQSLDSLRGTV
jgi:hypothetical protein